MHCCEEKEKISHKEDCHCKHKKESNLHDNHCDYCQQHDSHEHMHHHNHESHEHHMSGPEAAKDFLRRFWIVTFLLIPLFVFSEKGLKILGLPDFSFRKYIQFGLATIIFYYARVFFEHASHEIKARQYGMMTLVSLAVLAGYLFSAASTFLPALEGVEFYLEISTLIWVLLFGHYLEAKSSAAAGDALSEVAKLLPKKAHRIKFQITNSKIQINSKHQIPNFENLEYKDVEVESLKAGDFVLVKAGEKVPADGVIVEGSAFLNEALITGESKPVEKTKGSEVVAGSICTDGQLILKIKRVGENSTVGQIKKLIAQAQKTKPRAQRIADKAASVLTFTALSVALATVIVWSFIIGKPFVFSLTLAITVLVIACPHALGLAIPTVSTIATTLAVKNGFFIKDMSKLEVVKDVDWVIFDKTGTLTEGKFEVVKLEIPNTKSQISNKHQASNFKHLLAVVASLEQGSTHPIALAIVEKAKKEGIKFLKIEKFRNIAGKGVEGVIEGKKYFLGSVNFAKERLKFNKSQVKEIEQYLNSAYTPVVLFDENEILAIILLGDKIKRDSYKAVEELHKLGVRVAMLTGDSKSVAEKVAKELKIDEYFAEVMPEDKYKHVKRLQEKGYKVMMVGDGINDAPALVQADIGVAVGAGTDLAVEAGDIVLTRNNPKDIVALIKLSRAVYKKMLENLFWALGYNIIAIPAAAGVFMPFGIRLRPEWASILMSLSSVIVVINAFRLKSFKA